MPRTSVDADQVGEIEEEKKGGRLRRVGAVKSQDLRFSARLRCSAVLRCSKKPQLF